MVEATAHGENRELVALELWRLPTNFFELSQDEQWEAIARVTVPPCRRTEPREPCKLAPAEDALSVLFFLVVLGLPLAIPVVAVVLFAAGSRYLSWFLALVLFLVVHPVPKHLPWYRRNRLSVILCKYFTVTFLIDRSHPEAHHWCTKAVEANPVQTPCVCLACPHGVLNFGAIIWVAFSRWICGAEQYTASASVVMFVPGLRYLAAALSAIPVDRRSLKAALQEPLKLVGEDGTPIDTSEVKKGGMIGIVPDGIAGIFKSKPGVDALFIGKKRGLMRVCLEEGAIVFGGWFSGTSETFTILTDPFGIMESLSRKLKVSLFFFYGRWGLPVPHRAPITLCPSVIRCKKTPAPSNDEVEKLHQDVYGGMAAKFEELRHFAGYPERTLAIL